MIDVGWIRYFTKSSAHFNNSAAMITCAEHNSVFGLPDSTVFGVPLRLFHHQLLGPADPRAPPTP